MNANIIYLNPAQQAVYNYSCRHTTVEAGRATGKTSGMLAPYNINCVRTMPGGTGLILAPSLKSGLTKTVPSLCQAIEQITGLREGVHFVRGNGERFGFMRPMAPPRVWENCIHFWNGFVWVLTSPAIKASANGMNLCAIMGDEMRFMKEDAIKGEILPALRGVITDHPGFDEKRNPFYRSTMFVSDAPLTRSQGWMRKRRDEQTMEINRKIAALIREGQECPEIVQSEKYQRALNTLRCQAYIYFSFSTVEGIELLGESFLKEMKRMLTPTMFDISIRNIEKECIADGYYMCFNPDIHCYENDDMAQLEMATRKFSHKTTSTISEGGRTRRIENEEIDLRALVKADDCTLDTDIIPGEPLRIALDYNSKLSCIVTGQTPSRRNSQTLKILSSFAYTKTDRVEGLIKRWCKYYAPHPHKEVIFYYDATAKQGAAYASARYEETQFHNIVKRILRQNGWRVTEVSMGTPMAHAKKYEIINNCLSGTMKPTVEINSGNNEFLIASIENAGVLDGFRKDKSREKYRTAAGSDDADIERQLATRTDMSDAFDTLLLGVRNFGSGVCVGVGMPLVS